MLSQSLSRPTSSLAASQTIGEAILHHAAQSPDAAAIVPTGLPPLTYRDLALHIQQVGDQLRSAGLGPSARVGLLLPAGPESALLGIVIASRAVSVPFNPRIGAEELEQDLVRFKLDAIVAPDWQSSPGVEIAARHSLVTLLASQARGAYAVSLSAASRRNRGAGGQPGERAALVLRTSGTTGPAKFVTVTHRNLIAMAGKVQGWFGLTPQDRAACAIPTYYAQGLKICLLVPLLLGGSIALPDQPTDDFSAWVKQLRPTWLSAGPAYLQSVLDRLRSAGGMRPEHSLRFIITAAAPISEAVRSELEAALGIPILDAYGLSEAGLMAANPAPPQRRKVGTVGLPAPGELAIRGDDDRLLSVGEVGEIVVRGPSITPGYLDGQENVHADKDGWLATGDLGRIDADGFLSIVGRKKEIINRGGEKISPYEIEAALLAHPGVREAAAFPVPHPRLGENVAASVVLNPGAALTSRELRAFLHGRLADFKIPQQISFTSELPRGDTGKVSRSRLAAEVAAQVRQITTPGSMLEFQIAEIWQRLLERPHIGVLDDFFELGGDSLLWAQMLVELDPILGRPIPQLPVRELTVRGLADALMNLVPETNDLITCAQEGSRRPFFFFHGDLLTRGFYGTRLARLLDKDQPLYLLHPYRTADMHPGVTIPGMASSYVPHLLSLQPSGAFRIGGFCNGGLFAWEVAHQLTKAGRQVEFVVLIDTISLNALPIFRLIERALRLRAWTSPDEVEREIRIEGMRKAWAWGRRHSKTVDIAWHAQVMEPAGKIHRAMLTYIPPKVDALVIAVRSEEMQKKAEYLPAAWARLSRGVKVAHISGEHHTCVTIHLAELAAVLDGLLASVTPSCES